jgi:uncharacterized membrane protein YesL
MNLNWFKRTGIIFVPKNIIGWIIMLAGIGYAVYVFIDIDRKSHSVSDTMITFVFNLLIIIAFYTLIAFLTSRKSNK